MKKKQFGASGSWDKTEEELAIEQALLDSARTSNEQGFQGTNAAREIIKKNAGPLLPQKDPLVDVVNMPTDQVQEQPFNVQNKNLEEKPIPLNAPSYRREQDGQGSANAMRDIYKNTEKSLEQQKAERSKILEMIKESAARKADDQGVANLLRAKARMLSFRKNVPSSEDVAKSIEGSQDTLIDSYKEQLKNNSPTSLLELAKLGASAEKEGGVGTRADRTGDRADQVFGYKKIKDVQDALNSDKIAINAQNENAGIDKVLSIAEKDIRGVDGIMLSNAAKALGRDSGNIAVQESERILNRTFNGDIQQLANYLGSTDSSVMTPDQKRNMILLFKTVRDKNLDILDSRVDYHSYQGSQRTGQPVEQVREQSIIPTATKPKPAAQPQVEAQPTQPLTPEQRKKRIEELKRKQGGQ